MSEWNHRMCGDCWIAKNPITAIDDEDRDFSWRPPVQVSKTPPGTCCFCGNKTVLGIFVRHNPATLTCGARHGEEVDDTGFGLF